MRRYDPTAARAAAGGRRRHRIDRRDERGAAAGPPSGHRRHARDELGGAGRTLGVEQVDTPYLAFRDDDSWPAPGALRRAADLLDRHPRLAVVTGRILVGVEQREDPVCAEMAASPLVRDPELPGAPLLSFLAGASVLRRSAYLDMGGFEPKLGIGGEEELLGADLVSADGQWPTSRTSSSTTTPRKPVTRTPAPHVTPRPGDRRRPVRRRRGAGLGPAAPPRRAGPRRVRLQALEQSQLHSRARRGVS